MEWSSSVPPSWCSMSHYNDLSLRRLWRVQTWGRIGSEGHTLAGFHVQADIVHIIFTTTGQAVVLLNDSCKYATKSVNSRTILALANIIQRDSSNRWHSRLSTLCPACMSFLNLRIPTCPIFLSMFWGCLQAHRKSSRYQETWVSHGSFF